MDTGGRLWILDTNGRFKISDTIGRFWISDTSVRFWISDTGGLFIILNGSGQFCVLALADFGSWTLVAVSFFGSLWHGPFLKKVANFVFWPWQILDLGC